MRNYFQNLNRMMKELERSINDKPPNIKKIAEENIKIVGVLNFLVP